MTRQLLLLLQSIPCGGKQVHDANIVASMLVRGVPNLPSTTPPTSRGSAT
ncbi:MAG: hypothetical protein U0791_01715 [Gemmataceae bacterium]